MTAPVSAIIPCYNSQATLERAVNSVLNQTVRPAELIIVDDGSTDGTAELMRDLKRGNGDWISLIHNEKNLGPATSRNLAWSKASQTYVAFLDADDSWHIRKIEIQHRYMQEHAELAMSGHAFVVVSGPLTPPIPADYQIRRFTAQKLLFRNPFITPGVMIKREVTHRFPERRSHMEDHLLWMEIALTYGPIDLIQLPLAFLFKAQWGESGLSSQMWSMEKGELFNYRYLLSERRISIAMAGLLIAWSLLKFVRRILIKCYRLSNP